MKTILSVTVTAGLFFNLTCLAETFEASGQIKHVDVASSKIQVGAEYYRLPNHVTESSSSARGPAIFQLRPGTWVAFSGVQASPYPIIKSLAIDRQSTPVEEMELQQELSDENN